jgi:hypothetical protein
MVRCENWVNCTNTGCLHYKLHEPLQGMNVDTPERDCTEEISICPLYGIDTLCYRKETVE